MPFDARVFQILIASPGDVQAEREIITEVIHEWNSLNSREKRIVLLPLKWETHSSPELNEHAQSVINRQVVDHCDMAVGVFWTRMGTPTPTAESGTAEEVERVGRAGKPVMLYFSRAKVDLESVDLAEYARLAEFKEKTYPQSLIEKYETPLQFRDKFSRQLTIKVRELVAQHATDDHATSADRPGLTLRLARGEPPEVLPETAVIEVDRAVCVDEDLIPDYITSLTSRDVDGDQYSMTGRVNRDYWRESVRYYLAKDSYLPFRLAVENSDVQGVQDLDLDVVMTVKEGGEDIVDTQPPRLAPPVDVTYGGTVLQAGRDIYIDYSNVTGPPARVLQLRQESTHSWKMELEVPVVHAKRTVFSRNEFWVNAASPSIVELACTAYSANSVPLSLRTSLEIKINHREMSYKEILTEMGIPPF